VTARLLLAVAVAALLSGGGAGISCQTVAPGKATLDQVEELTQAGRTEDARAALLRWWSESRPKASRRDLQRGLWLRGRLTVDPSQAELDYRRLVVEYPGGPYSDQALMRLAQWAWESGDTASARQHVDRLAREYPGSRFRADAEAWLAAAGPPPAPPTPEAGDSATGAPAASTSGGAPSGATSAPGAAARSSAGASEVPAGDYAIQLGAFSSDDRALSLQRRAVEAGFAARLVRIPGSELVRVRIGRFDSAAAAGDLLNRLKGLGFTAALVPDANREERIKR
jgi:SPOR domain